MKQSTINKIALIAPALSIALLGGTLYKLATDDKPRKAQAPPVESTQDKPQTLEGQVGLELRKAKEKQARMANTNGNVQFNTPAKPRSTKSKTLTVEQQNAEMVRKTPMLDENEQRWIFKAYKSNPVRFESDFNNTAVKVYGKVDSISSGWLGHYVRITNGAGSWQCYFDNPDSLVNLNTGETVIIGGGLTGNGFEIFGHVQLSMEHCIITEN